MFVSLTGVVEISKLAARHVFLTGTGDHRIIGSWIHGITSKLMHVQISQVDSD